MRSPKYKEGRGGGKEAAPQRPATTLKIFGEILFKFDSFNIITEKVCKGKKKNLSIYKYLIRKRFLNFMLKGIKVGIQFTFLVNIVPNKGAQVR